MVAKCRSTAVPVAAYPGLGMVFLLVVIFVLRSWRAGHYSKKGSTKRVRSQGKVSHHGEWENEFRRVSNSTCFFFNLVSPQYALLWSIAGKVKRCFIAYSSAHCRLCFSLILSLLNSAGTSREPALPCPPSRTHEKSLHYLFFPFPPLPSLPLPFCPAAICSCLQKKISRRFSFAFLTDLLFF